MTTNVAADRPVGTLPEGEALERKVASRRRTGKTGEILLLCSLIFGILALATLIYTITDDQMGYAAYEYRVAPETLTDGRPLEDLSQQELLAILQDKLSAGRVRQLNRESALDQRPQGELVNLVLAEVSRERIVKSWSLVPSLFQAGAIRTEVAEEFPNARIEWRNWIGSDFLTTPMSSQPGQTGIRTALLGTLYLILLTIILSVPTGIAAAIYLEEYNVQTNGALSWINRVIETNINNLAGVPSIIYGILGLSIFVRGLERYTSGQFIGVTDTNGRTLVSAALTMSLLILPLIIINSREAIRAVPNSMRQASYGLGATKWQTVWQIVLPTALPGILTGTILGVSRAIGETAPLIVVGASTYIVTDPNGPFSKFTVLPIQIYNWTSQPSPEWVRAAAGAILVLMAMLLALNTVAIVLRNRFRRSY
ncbi:MAG: phosphate ABC transporter permease PstA [Chloroflexales bacterium]|nr:phosphate ABC transporter permease PstA [Chloroflexales bacterium]